jgi:membrane-bound serine protease (ClpP class)
MESFDSAGKVWLEGEAWEARSPIPVTKDQKLVVTRLDGLTLDVEPADEDPPPKQPAQ